MGLGNLFFAPKVLVTIFTRKYDEGKNNQSAQIVFAPILWAQGTLRKARSDGLFPSDFLYKAIHE